MNAPNAGPQYDAKLRAVLETQDWAALRDFAREENQVPDDLNSDDRHFWEVLLHKLVCNRADMAEHHERSRAWLDANGYTAALEGY